MRDAPSSTSPRRPADALDEAMKLPPQQGQRQTYSFDEAMKLPPQEPEPDSASMLRDRHWLDLQRSRLLRQSARLSSLGLVPSAPLSAMQ